MPMTTRYMAHLTGDDVAADTPYVLVDLSDTTNFPHSGTNELHVLGLMLSAEKASDGVYDVYVGVVTENDADDGSVSWLYQWNLESVLNPTDSTDRFHQYVDFTLGGSNPEGINCLVESGALVRFVTNNTQADSANWQNDTNRTSPVGATTKPGVGDIVVFVDEVSGSGTLDFSVIAIYEAL